MKVLVLTLMSLLLVNIAQAAEECDFEFATYIAEQGMGESMNNDCKGDGQDLQHFGEAYDHFIALAKPFEANCSEAKRGKFMAYLECEAINLAFECVSLDEFEALDCKKIYGQ